MRRPALIPLALTALVAAGLPAFGIAPVATLAASAVEVCEVEAEGFHAKVRPGAKVAERDPSRGESDLLQGVEPTSVSAAGSIPVRTVVHVISTSARTAATDRMVKAQMAVLNSSFAGQQGADAMNTPFRFDLVAVTRTINPAWGDLGNATVEQQVKTQLRQGGKETLNVYVGPLGGGLLGYAYFPVQPGTQTPKSWQDGVVVLDESLPGGSAVPYHLGDTLPHEVGHWLGLHHTFAGGCSTANDGISDTPAEAYPNFVACSEDEGTDTCARLPGLDPVENFMDYSDDLCMNAFTRGQAARMDAIWKRYRAA